MLLLLRSWSHLLSPDRMPPPNDRSSRRPRGRAPRCASLRPEASRSSRCGQLVECAAPGSSSERHQPHLVAPRGSGRSSAPQHAA